MIDGLGVRYPRLRTVIAAEADMDNEVKLTIEIKNLKPVELVDYAQSMICVGSEYTRFLASGENAATPDDVKLYVKAVRTGSIITELVAIAPFAIPFIEHSATIFEFAKHLKVLLDWFAGRSDKKPEALEKTTLQNLSNIVEPVAKDNGAQMNLGAVNVAGDMNLTLNISSLDANAIQNAIRREIDAMKEPVTGIHPQVLMYWAQARNQPDSKSGDKARIESIFRGDVKVVFANDRLKSKMLYEPAHPFALAYVVDVAVETIEGRPALYRVLEVHEAVSRDA